MADAKLHLPIAVAGYTDFYSSKEHATNVGVMFRGKDNALQPNWLHMPIGYNGRASTVVVCGTKVRRPRGQLKPPERTLPSFGPCKRLDFELEMGVVVGQPSPMGEMLTEKPGRRDDLRLRAPQRLERARHPAMGICAARAVPGKGVRDLDQPVGRDARGAGAVPASRTGAGSDAAAVSAAGRSRTITICSSTSRLRASAMNDAVRICRTNFKYMYWSSVQQLVHHASSGCAMNVGDLLGSGTISGPEKHQRGSLLEISWNGTEPLESYRRHQAHLSRRR